jgi:hypothetical protein
MDSDGRDQQACVSCKWGKYGGKASQVGRGGGGRGRGRASGSRLGIGRLPYRSSRQLSGVDAWASFRRVDVGPRKMPS